MTSTETLMVQQRRRPRTPSAWPPDQPQRHQVRLELHNSASNRPQRPDHRSPTRACTGRIQLYQCVQSFVRTLNGDIICCFSDGMVYTRGAADDYGAWARITGDPGWSWKRIFPYAKKVWISDVSVIHSCLRSELKSTA